MQIRQQLARNYEYQDGELLSTEPSVPVRAHRGRVCRYARRISSLSRLCLGKKSDFQA